MTTDPINDEIRAIRRKLAAQCDDNVERIFAEARLREATDGRTYVTLAPRLTAAAVDEQTGASVSGMASS